MSALNIKIFYKFFEIYNLGNIVLIVIYCIKRFIQYIKVNQTDMFIKLSNLNTNVKYKNILQDF